MACTPLKSGVVVLALFFYLGLLRPHLLFTQHRRTQMHIVSIGVMDLVL
jgi:hypothetical protein